MTKEITMIYKYSFFLLVIICLTSCTNITATPTHILPPVSVLVTPTFTAIPTKTQIPTLLPTLTSLQANEKINAYLQKNVDCLAPCFWGITPKKTTFREAMNIFASLGLELEQTNAENNQKFYATQYHIEKDIEITIILTVQDDIIKTLSAGMNVYSENGTQRTWAAYSPETLIERYGQPSKVDFTLGRSSPTPTHSMALYFENVDMIILYVGGIEGFLKNADTLELCPLTNTVNFITIWMGDEPRHPPSKGIPLEEATSLTIEDFSKLMGEDSTKACFYLKDVSFP